MADTQANRGWYPDPEGSRRRRFWDGSKWTVHYAPGPPSGRFAAAVAMVIVIPVFMAGFGACAFGAYVASRSFSIAATLDPIPVPYSSCPYLRGVHDTAARAGAAWATVAHEPETSRLHAAPLARALSQFDVALRRAEPRVPAQIATKLQEVQVYVAVGRSELKRAATGSDYSNSTFGSVSSGYASLRDASDLTGSACGFVVAPDPEVALGGTTVGNTTIGRS